MELQNAATSRFVSLMRVFTGIYAVGAAAFFLFHSSIATLLGAARAPDRFWVVLATAMMAMLSFLSWQSSRRPQERAFVRGHLLSKAVSVLAFLLSFADDPATKAYLLGAGVDLTVFLVVAISYRNMAVANRLRWIS